MGSNLKVLDLTSCQKLTRTPDFSKLNALERLILEDCRRLSKIGRSIVKLVRLKHLNVKGCDSLEGLPKELDSLDALEEIFMRGCGGSFTLPKSIGTLKSLAILEVSRVKIIELPPSITRLANLKRLSLSRCSRVKKLPVSLGELKSLVELNLSSTKITELPDSIGKLVNLEVLSISECSGIEKLPDSIGNLMSLVRLNISRTVITKIPDSIRNLKELKVIEMARSCVRKLPKAIGQVEKLEESHAKRCKMIGVVPDELEELSQLRILDLSCTAVSTLPSLNRPTVLHTLHLEWCDHLQELPELPSSLIRLHMTSLSLQKLPDLSGLNNLISLKLYDATCISPSSALQPSNFDWISKLSSLVTLELCLSNITNLPKDFRAFYQLKKLELSCTNLPGALQLPHSLSKLVLGYMQGKKLPNLSHLKNLSYLRLYNCSIEAGFENLAVGKLEPLNSIEIMCCFFERFDASHLPENLEKLTVHRCRSLKILLHLSRLKNLKQLYLSECEKLMEVHGLGELLSLEWLDVVGCHSLESLENLSKLEKLELLNVDDCRKLVDFEGGGRIKSMQHLLRNRYLARGTDILFSSGSPTRAVQRRHRRVASL
ncbi:leucine-rich repeat protein soc-2 homolog isoform X1 [Punica granatum]|nr:leucine-rich repeat protein soc-2 homolog isoform X1 [Punica granatum]XP_031398705.1 leucine-rich repeat protein soc-2 homolog isoform X1 [Punica granatum]